DPKHIAAPATAMLAQALARLGVFTLWHAQGPRPTRAKAAAPAFPGGPTFGDTTIVDAILKQTSHEFRGPLTALKTTLQLGERQVRQLLDAETLPDSAAAALGEIRTGLERAVRYADLEDRLTAKLEDTSQIQMRKLEVHPLA